MAGGIKYVKQPSSRGEIFQKQFSDWFDGWNNGERSVFAGFGDNFSNLLPGGAGAGGGGGGKKPKPPVTPPTQPESYQWTFPQYSQTWAFTPPNPTPYLNPAPFDTKKYGDPFSKKNSKV